jgi:AAA+ ATPase superfamily predicted ATPase
MQIDPIFVNRRTQLRLLDDVLASLQRGERRHIALLGLRRIGKTILLDEVRARHPDQCIIKLSVDTIVSTPEGFALDVISAVLDGACRVRGIQRTVTGQPRSIVAAAAVLSADLVPHLEELLDLVEQPRAYGRLLAKLFIFPSTVSGALDLPILIILDEFQGILKLRNFPGTENLLAALREALDRRGKVAYTIAGSIVTYLRQILRDGNDPLFSRFDEHYLPPFAPEDSRELVTGVWERVKLSWDAEAVERVHSLTQGYPFYAHVIARAAADLAHSLADRATRDCIDATFQQLLLDRDSALAIYLQYLYVQAIADVRGENIPDAVMRFLARHEWSRVAEIARGIRRSAGQINDVVSALIAIDILRRRDDGGIGFVDPLLPVWIAIERERLEPGAALANPRVRDRLIQAVAERLAALQDAMGPLFERQVQNVVRQFRGQRVPAKLLGGEDGDVILPIVQDVQRVDLPDPIGRFSGKPGGVEIDGVTTGTETWLIEAKNRRGGVTAAQVDAFLRKCEFFEQLPGHHVDQKWIVSETGFRSEARARCLTSSTYFTDAHRLRQLEQAVRQSP